MYHLREWSEFSGIADLKLEDQQMLYMEVVGRPMEPSQLAKNTKNIKNIEIKELISNCDVDSILYAVLKKHIELLTVAELKVACAAHKLVLDKKAARVDIIDIIMKKKIDNFQKLSFFSNIFIFYGTYPLGYRSKLIVK